MYSFPDAAAVLGAGLQAPDSSRLISGASIDTRTLEKGNLFVALRGVKEDGHRYLAQAFSKGASGALIEKEFFERNLKELEGYSNLLSVQDTFASFTALAKAYRSRFKIPTAGITGSVGKTSTKEFLHFLLSQNRNVLATRGNFNNHLGLPLTLFGLNESHQACVAELGANHKGEIRELASVLKPDHAILTCVAPVHLSGFGSLEGIYEAKLELFESLRPGSTAVIPDDDAVLFARAGRMGLHVVRVGQSPLADYRISEVRVLEGLVHFRVNGRPYAFPGIAKFLARNAAMAIALAEAMGMKISEIPAVWTNFILPSGRFQSRLLENGVTLIDDGYNASPVSFKAALEVFSGFPAAGRRVLVFADMLELGSEEIHYHEELGEKIANAGLDLILAYGPLAGRAIQKIKSVNSSLHALHFEGPRDIAAFLRNRLKRGDMMLLKASRGMKIEEVTNLLSFPHDFRRESIILLIPDKSIRG